jgi:hypothetical protein
MEFPGAGNRGQGFYIFGIHAATDQEDEAVAGLLYKTGDQFTAFPGVFCHAGGQQARASQGDDGLERFGGVLGADVEGAVEGNRKRLRGSDEPSHGSDVDMTFLRQRSDNNSCCSYRLAIRNVCYHIVYRILSINKSMVWLRSFFNV